MLYVWATPGQTVTEPLILPGCEGGEITDTVKIRGELVPHELVALTLIVPDVELGIAEME
jgi:hypothetical protein